MSKLSEQKLTKKEEQSLFAKPDWRFIYGFDDLIPKENQKEIKELEEENSCPFLGRRGEYFNYCKKVVALGERSCRKPSKESPICAAKAIVSLGERQLYCNNKSNFEECPVYQKRPIDIGDYSKRITPDSSADFLAKVFPFSRVMH